MSSWVSHLPEEMAFSRVVGHGMNAAEAGALPGHGFARPTKVVGTSFMGFGVMQCHRHVQPHNWLAFWTPHLHHPWYTLVSKSNSPDITVDTDVLAECVCVECQVQPAAEMKSTPCLCGRSWGATDS